MSDQAADERFLALVQSDPSQALNRLEEYLLSVRGDEPSGMRSTILRGAALASRFTGDFAASDRFIEQALVDAKVAGDERRAIEAYLTRSGNLLLQGHPQRALSEVEQLEVPEDPRLRGRVETQAGTILARLGRSADALDRLGRAVVFADSAGDRVIQATAEKSRGMLLLQRGEHDLAATDFEMAKGRFSELGLEFEVAFCEHNLGVVASSIGDLPTAFARFETSEQKMRDLSGSDFESKAGHCRALLSAGLFREAAELSAESAKRCFELGFDTDGSESLLISAAAWLEANNATLAEESAAQAAEAFRSQGRSGWRASAELVEIGARYRAGKTADQRELAALVVELIDAEHHRDALEAELLLAELEASAGRPADGLRRIEGLKIRLENGPTDLLLSAATAQAVCYFESGQDRLAEDTAAHGFKLLREQQSFLRSSDLRVGVRQHADRLSRIGLSISIASNDAAATLRWQENIDLATSTPRPVRPEKDREMRAALATLRTLDDPSGAHRRALEDRVRTLGRSRRSDSEPRLESLDPSKLALALGDAAGVSYSILDQELVATVLAGGDVQLHNLGPVASIEQIVRGLRTDLRRRATTPSRARPERVRAALAKVDELVLAPLAIDGRPLVVAATTPLIPIPWASLPSREALPTSVATSLTGWAVTAARTVSPSTSVFVGGSDLEHAGQEIDSLLGGNEGASHVMGDQATVDKVLSAIDGASLAHIVAHGTVRTDNPLFSSLRMADGELSVYELGDLQQAPSVVVLSACHVGLPAEAPGQELLGMVTGFLNAGTSCVVASTLPVPDDQSTIDMMSRFHRFLREGMTPASAWAEVQRTCIDDEQLLDTATFTVFGRG